MRIVGFLFINIAYHPIPFRDREIDMGNENKCVSLDFCSYTLHIHPVSVRDHTQMMLFMSLQLW